VILLVDTGPLVKMDNYDHVFTPELIAKLDAARAEARTGNNLTMEQVKENLKVKRDESNTHYRSAIVARPPSAN
jgi:hypothetical protein